MTGKCAVVLLVKDEASDIAAWLAWYHVLGFDACIVFDDDSTDGTWEILQNARGVQDIRLQRSLGDRNVDHQRRQDDCYRYAIKTYADEFEWLAFFDADEFLALARDVSIQEFLARFAHADQVCINWCNYGSSGHVLKPSLLPFEAYTCHAGPEQMINRHVKSIIRPKRIGPNWICVHCFDALPERSFLANGKPVSWSPVRGIIDTDPDWSVAKLMHYQCRSMEHFIERLKRRPELQNQPRLWEFYDFNDAQDRVPLALAARVRAQVARVLSGSKDDLIFDIGMSEGNDTAFYLAKGFRVVGVEPDVHMVYRLQARFEPEIAEGRLLIHNLAAGAAYGEIVEFFHHEQHQGLSGLSNARPEFAAGYKSYFVMTIGWAALVEKHGVPHYAKIDIEGQEAAFLSGVAPGSALPRYISVECHQFEPVQKLYDLGYRHFKLVDQLPPGGFTLPAEQFEGKTLQWTEFFHTSGPFGRDLAGEWVDFAVLRTQWQAAQAEYHRTWFDCHAWMP